MQSLNRLPAVLWLIMPTGKWPWSDAMVYSHRYSYGWDENGQIWHSELSYSFRLNDILYVGHARWNDSVEPAGFERNETIRIRYNPLNPDIPYFPEKDSLLGKRFLLILAFGMLLYAAVLALMAHHRHTQ